MNVKKSLKATILPLFFLISVKAPVFAQTEERTINVEVSSTGAEARQEAFQKAVQLLSRELAERRLGRAFLDENTKRFESEVLSKSDKYVLSIKGAGTKATASGGTEVSVVLSISHDAFDSVLRQSGLQQLSRQNLAVVIFLDEQDKANREGPWWVQGQLQPLSTGVQGLRTRLMQELKRKGIEVVDQKRVFSEMPPEFKKPNLTREELVQLGRKHQASLVLFGLVSPKGSEGMIYHAQWIQVPAERVLSEIQGESKNMTEMSEKFLNPITQAQAAGTLNTRPFTLRVRGELSPLDLKNFKDELTAKVRDIRSLKERLMGRGDFSFEAESPQSPSALAGTIQALSFKDFWLKASLEGEDQILLSLKKR